MEAIIRTNDRNTFNSLVQFLKSLHIEVETKTEETNVLPSNLKPMTLEEFYERNHQSQKEIATGKLISQNDVTKHFERKNK